MVLPPPTADDAPGAHEASWLRPLKRALRLSQSGVLVRVDKARPEALGDLVRALLPEHPELEVETEARRVVEAPPGAARVLVPRATDADWLNLNRPLFSQGALRVVLFCDEEMSRALARQAVDFFDWISHHVECPSIPVRHAVAGLRCALAARAPGITWTGGDLEACFAAALPRRVLRRVSAASSFAEIRAEVKSHRSEWLAWSELNSPFQLQRVRWALAEARRKTKAILVQPAVESPGWWQLHGRTAEAHEARKRLGKAGARNPGRLAALLGLEPEAIELLAAMLEGGRDEQALETTLRRASDPGAELGLLALEQGWVSNRDVVRDLAAPPVLRAWTMGIETRQRLRKLRQAELEQVAKRLQGGGPVDVTEAAWWGAWTTQALLPPISERTSLRNQAFAMEPELRNHVANEQRFSFVAHALGDIEAADLWIQRALKTSPASVTTVLIHANVLDSLGKYPEAEDLLRRTLSLHARATGEQTKEREALLLALGLVLRNQGKYKEAEESMRQSLALNEQSQESQPPPSGESLHALATVLEHQGRYREAEILLHQSLALKEQTLGRDHLSYGESLNTLATVLLEQGKHEEAGELLRQVLALKEQALGKHNPSYAESLKVLATVLAKQGLYEDAEVLMRQSLAVFEQTMGQQHPGHGAALHALASVLERQGKVEEAEKLLRQALAIEEKALGGQHPSLCPTLANLGSLLAGQGRPHEGEPLIRRAVDIARAKFGLQHPDTARALNLLAQIQHVLGKPEAATTAREALDALSGSLGPEHPTTREVSPILLSIAKD